MSLVTELRTHGGALVQPKRSAAGLVIMAVVAMLVAGITVGAVLALSGSASESAGARAGLSELQLGSGDPGVVAAASGSDGVLRQRQSALAFGAQPGLTLPVATAVGGTDTAAYDFAIAVQPGVAVPVAIAIAAAPGSQPASDFAIGAQPGVLFPLEASPAPVAAVSIDAFNQNPHQNPALTTAPVPTSSARSVDTLNQNPRQNPLAAPTTSTVAQSEEPEVFNQNPRHA